LTTERLCYNPAMFRLVATVTAFLFFVWLIPMGIFIKAAQEKIACGGQRAICLCSHQQAKLKNNPAEGYSFQNNSANSKESNASGGGAGHFFLAVHLPVENGLNAADFDNVAVLACRNPFLKSIEHIPKV
jgi:hypothetical protein